MSMALITALISAGGLVLGSVIGAVCSFFVNKVSMHEQMKLQHENLMYQESCNAKEKYTNANIIRLDFCNAIYQSIRAIKSDDINFVTHSIPIYKEYHKIIASLGDEYSLKQLSYIYQFYNVLEINSKIIENTKYNDFNEKMKVQNAFKNILIKVYGENYIKLLSKDINYVTFEELYCDKNMKSGYRNIFKSLDMICLRCFEQKTIK